MEETKNGKLVEEKEQKLRSKNSIVHGVEESSSDNKDDAIKSDDIYINNFIAALKVTSTVKSASRLLKLQRIRKRKETGFYQI